jgi:hypothetical protein
LGLAGAGCCPLTRTTILIQTSTSAATFALVALRAVISVAIAAGLRVLMWSRLRRSLDVTTDVVGYPIVSDFNVDRYLWIYGLCVAFFPLTAFAIDLALSRLTGGAFPWPDTTPPIPRRTIPSLCATSRRSHCFARHSSARCSGSRLPSLGV